MAATKIIKAKVENNRVLVWYSTGTEKSYSADKLPKTVASWLAANAEPAAEPAPAETSAETTEAREGAENRGNQGAEPAQFEKLEPAEVQAAPETATESETEPARPVKASHVQTDHGGIIWDITTCVILPVMGAVLTAAAFIMQLLAMTFFWLALFAAWIGPKATATATTARATAATLSRIIRKASGRIAATATETATTAANAARIGWTTAKRETPILLEAVKERTTAAVEYRREVINNDFIQIARGTK